MSVYTYEVSFLTEFTAIGAGISTFSRLTGDLQVDESFSSVIPDAVVPGQEQITAEHFKKIVEAMSSLVFHTHSYVDVSEGNCNCNCNCTRGIL